MDAGNRGRVVGIDSAPADWQDCANCSPCALQQFARGLAIRLRRCLRRGLKSSVKKATTEGVSLRAP
jgi:hypothetical protein